MGLDWLMSSASPCGRPSMMSVMTTSSARPFSAMRCTVVEPYFPAPMTVTFIPGPLPRSCDDRVGDVAGADRGGVVAVRLHVVGDALALGDDRGERALEPVGRLALVQVPQHEHAREHHRHRVDLVLPLVLGGRAVRGLEHRDLVAHVRPRRDPEPADQPGGEVGEDVAVEVGQQQHVEVLGLLHELHAHVVHEVLVVLDRRVLLGDLATDRVEEPVGVLHDVRLAHGGDLLAAVGARVIEGEPGDPPGAGDRDRLDGDAGVLTDAPVLEAVQELDHLLRVLAALLELDAGVEVLVVLAHDHQVDVLVARAHALVPLAGAQAGEQVELLAQGHVDAAEPGADRRGQGTLDRYPVAPDRLQHRLGERRAVPVDDVGARLLDVPVELDTGPLEDAPGGFGQLRPYSVARDEGDTVGHVGNSSRNSLQRGAKRVTASCTRPRVPLPRTAALTREAGAGAGPRPRSPRERRCRRRGPSDGRRARPAGPGPPPPPRWPGRLPRPAGRRRRAGAAGWSPAPTSRAGGRTARAGTLTAVAAPRSGPRPSR